jgi:uncharacterized protein
MANFFEALLDAVLRGDEVGVAHILDIGDFSEGLSESDENGMTALHWAATSPESERLIPNLLARGAYIDTKNNFGHTPLHLCCAQGRLYAVTCLLHKGADVNAPTAVESGSVTPLHLAIQHNHSDIVRLLLAFGADAGLRNAEKKTAFDLGLAEILDNNAN